MHASSVGPCEIRQPQPAETSSHRSYHFFCVPSNQRNSSSTFPSQFTSLLATIHSATIPLPLPSLEAGESSSSTFLLVGIPPPTPNSRERGEAKDDNTYNLFYNLSILRTYPSFSPLALSALPFGILCYSSAACCFGSDCLITCRRQPGRCGDSLGGRAAGAWRERICCGDLVQISTDASSQHMRTCSKRVEMKIELLTSHSSLLLHFV